MILILDFGSQYTQLIARRIREAHVYSEIHPYNIPLERIRQMSPEGIILSGGPASVYDAGAPVVDASVLDIPGSVETVAGVAGSVGAVVPLAAKLSRCSPTC